MHIGQKLAACLLASSAAAIPMAPVQRRQLPSITSNIIQTISPASASCDGAPDPDQCRTACQAAGPIAQSLAAYRITTLGEAAAVISLMAYESVDFKYQNNVSPGRPGQGTRNMQMINYNLLYAQSIPSVAANLSSITNGQSAESLSPDQANAVRALLTADDDFDFGSGAWFLTTQCPMEIRQNLQTGSLSGWQDYMASCVGTPATDDRQAYWSRAVSALS